VTRTFHSFTRFLTKVDFSLNIIWNRTALCFKGLIRPIMNRVLILGFRDKNTCDRYVSFFYEFFNKSRF
jgi:hypothetical protein